MDFPKIPYYHIDSLINEGGTAAVYKAVDLRSGYIVAVKALFPSRAQDDFIMQRFREEANHYLYLKHPHITELVDFIEHKGRFYIVMEYVDGQPLDTYMNTVTGPMVEERAIPLFRQILSTIAYLHQNNILHLDIKPSNIMKTKGGMKILDMGISAKMNDKSNNIKKCGSPAFMSPEQINQRVFGKYTDIFALGVTLFNMLTGRLPFSGATNTDIFQKIIHDPVPQAALFYPGINAFFQPILEKAMHKNSFERYQTCEEFEMALLNLGHQA